MGSACGGHHDQSPEAIESRAAAAMAADEMILTETEHDKLQRQRDPRFEKRDWGQRAKVLLGAWLRWDRRAACHTALVY